jgi:probable HAF family extracellular repeat protein
MHSSRSHIRARRRPMVLVWAAAGVATALACPAAASAAHPATTPAYELADVGTRGGPQAFADLPGVPITSRRVVLGSADTTIADEDFPNFNPFIGGPDPFLIHAFAWRDGKITDLGALPGNNSSGVFEINAKGVGAGMSETGAIDPLTAYPAMSAVLFEPGRVLNLGTLPGGHESFALAINDRGQAAGISSNGVPDPMSVFGWGTQTRGFVWQHGKMEDLGTLGGPDAVAFRVNARGQIAGDSFTDATPNPVTGAPTTHPFLWWRGHMRDLGTLGGTQTTSNWLNDRGEVVGQSTLTGDQATHPFLWDGQRLRDLGTLGGDFGSAQYIDEAGHAVGIANTTDDAAAHAFLWKGDHMTDLTGSGNPQSTFAAAINMRDQIVGGSFDGDALLWDQGQQYDLNTLIAPSTDHLSEAFFISDRGEIVAGGRRANGDSRLFVLNPENRSHFH